jgi:hypothetical protein
MLDKIRALFVKPSAALLESPRVLALFGGLVLAAVVVHMLVALILRRPVALELLATATLGVPLRWSRSGSGRASSTPARPPRSSSRCWRRSRLVRRWGVAGTADGLSGEGVNARTGPVTTTER